MRALPSNERGQFLPITIQVMFAAVVLIIAVVNVYHVTRAKLQAQNMADAVALAVAAMEAKEINVVVDRDEWLNHMYSDGALFDKNQMPGISTAARGHDEAGRPVNKLPSTEYQAYANLVAAINQAQQMFIAAYERFIGADQGGTPSQNGGPGSLQDILSEIDGLKDPNVSVAVFNNPSGDQGSVQWASNQGHNTMGQSGQAHVTTPFGMTPVPFESIGVKVNVKENGSQSLNRILGLPDGSSDTKVGWMRPQWENGQLSVNTEPGKSSNVIGAGAVVVERVSLSVPLLQTIYVTARAKAYVVQNSGSSVDNSLGTDAYGKPLPPAHFRPTYYVKLGAHS